MALEFGLDQQQLYDDQDSDIAISQGMKSGVDRRFIRDMARWIQHTYLVYAPNFYM